MSPSVADFGSPTASPQHMQAKQQPPSVQEPTPNTGIPLEYGALSSHRPSGQYQSSAHADSNITTGPSLDNASEGGFSCAFTSKFGSQTSSDKSNLSSFSCRSRPRLVKVRKRLGSQQGKPTTVSAENSLGFNPFISVWEGSDRVKAATVASNGFGVSVSDARFGKFDGMSFASVANSSNLSSNPNKEERESCQSAGELNADEVGTLENGNFGSNKNITADVGRKLKHKDFSANKNISILKLNLERRQCSESTGQWGANVGFVFGAKKEDPASNSELGERKVNESRGSRASEFGKFNNVNFVFGANRSNLVSNSESFSDNHGNLAFSKITERRILSESATKATAYEFGNFDNVSIMHGTNESNFNSEERDNESVLEQTSSVSILEPTITNSAENVGNFDDMKGKVREDIATEISKLKNAGSIFFDNQRDMEKKESSEIAGKLAPDVKGKTRIDIGAHSGRLDGSGCVFVEDLCELESNSNLGKGESSELGKSASSNGGRMTCEAQVLGTANNVSFVFGAYQSGSASQSDLGNRDSSEITGEPVFDKKGDIEVDIGKAFQKKTPSSVLTFESGSKKNFSFSGAAKVDDDMDKVNNDNSGDFAGVANLYTDYLGSGVGINCNFSFGGHINRANMSDAGPLFSLSDEMKKLNIDNQLIGGCGKAFNSNTNPNAMSAFVYGSNKESFSSAGISGTAYCHQTRSKEYSLHGSTFDKSGKVNPKTSDKNAFLFENTKDAVCSLSGGVENMMNDDMKNKNTRMVGAMGEQVNFEFLSQNKEEPINFDEKMRDNPSVDIAMSKPFIFQAGSDRSFNGVPDQLNDDMKLNKVYFESSPLSTSLGFEAGSASKVESKDTFRFTSTRNSSRKKLDASSSFTMNLFPGLNKKLEFGAKSRAVRDKRLKKTMGKLRQATMLQQQSRKNQVPKGGVSEHIPESPGYCSPMDFSPHQDSNCISSNWNSTFSNHAKDECLVTERERADGNEDNEKHCEPDEKGSKNHGGRHCFADFLWEQFVSGADTEHPITKIEQVYTKSGGVAAEAGSGVSSNMKREESDGSKQFNFASSSEDTGKRGFAFSASSSQANLSAVKRQYRKKYRMKVGQGAPNQKVEFVSSSVQLLPLSSPSSHLNGAKDRKEDICKPQSTGENKSKADEEHAKQRSATAAAEEACENWRIRGNKAYKNGCLSKAEEFYTKGVNSVPDTGASGCCLGPLVLCYSNRAAARMSLGRMREALWDCVKAAELDPDFLKVQIRAANCHLALGEVENAMQYFNKCLESGSGVCLDRRVMIEAADGIQKAKKVAVCGNQCAELLQQRTSDSATCALGKTVEALSISPYSEKLLEMKGDAFFILRRFEEVIQLCKQTLDFAEKNFSVAASSYDLENVDASKFKKSSVLLWRWQLMSKSYFHLGRLEVALDLLEKHELLRSSNDGCESTTQGSLIPLAVTVRELVHRKNAGNEAFQSGCHAEAVDQYTAAISSSIESRPFAAVCFCNRAAAHQALGQIADAIADCSLAIAFDGKYTKAVSRRATLHETIRDYAQAAIDIQKLICVLEGQSREKVQQAGIPDGPADSNVKELRRAHRRLSALEENAKRGTSLDFYLILGVKASDPASEIKKAYRKAALRHHPDKAGQFLVRSESGDDGLIWKEIAEDVHKDADRLFKMIGEAYAVLSDPTKRSEYDLQEELRRAHKESNRSSSSRRPSDFYSPPFQSSSNRQSWRTYGSSHSQW